MAAASSPGLLDRTGDPLGCRDRAAAPRLSRAHRLGGVSGVQPRRTPHPHRIKRQHRDPLGCRDRAAAPRPSRAHRLGGVSGVQPRRTPHPHRIMGPDRDPLGCRDGDRSSAPSRAHVSVVHSVAFSPDGRRSSPDWTTIRRSSGTCRDRVGSSAPSAGTLNGSCGRWRSAPTDDISSPDRGTRRRSSGMPRPGQELRDFGGHTCVADSVAFTPMAVASSPGRGWTARIPMPRPGSCSAPLASTSCS